LCNDLSQRSTKAQILQSDSRREPMSERALDPLPSLLDDVPRRSSLGAAQGPLRIGPRKKFEISAAIQRGGSNFESVWSIRQSSSNASLGERTRLFAVRWGFSSVDDNLHLSVFGELLCL